MEQYKEKLKIQNITCGFCCVILLAFTICAVLGEMGILSALTPVTGDSHWQSRWRGFLCGASFGLMALMLAGMIRNIKALRNEKELKKLYVREKDERTIQIWTYARAAAFQTMLLVGLAAGVVAGYFSVTVGMTILVCLVASSAVGMGFKIYYSKKF